MDFVDKAGNSFSGAMSSRSPGMPLTQGGYATYLELALIITIPLALVGIVGNILNIRAFSILGLNEGVTVSFFALSVCDLFYTSIYFCLRIFTVLRILEEKGTTWFPVSPYVFTIFSANIILVSSSISMLTVTFLVLVRCLCVAMPLQFKHIFTTRKCIRFFVSFIFITVPFYVPIFFHMGVRRRFDPDKNATKFYMYISPGRKKVKDIAWFIFDMVLPVLIQVTLLVCVFVMTYKLQESAQFRHGSQGVGGQARGKGGVPTTTTTTTSSATAAMKAQTTKIKLSPRDVRVMIQVVLISVIYSVANSPKIFISLYGQIQPEFDINKRHQFYYLMWNDVRLFAECVNATVNFFVYYTFNTAFRTVCFRSSSPKVKVRAA